MLKVIKPEAGEESEGFFDLLKVGFASLKLVEVCDLSEPEEGEY